MLDIIEDYIIVSVFQILVDVNWSEKILCMIGFLGCKEIKVGATVAGVKSKGAPSLANGPYWVHLWLSIDNIYMGIQEQDIQGTILFFKGD